MQDGLEVQDLDIDGSTKLTPILSLQDQDQDCGG